MFCEPFSDYACWRVALWGLILACVPLVAAAAPPLPLSGVVVDERAAPVAGARVGVSGQNITVSTTTDGAGYFRFSTLGAGEYQISAQKGGLHATQVVELTSGGTTVRLMLARITTIRSIVVRQGSAPPLRGSGTDLTLNNAVLARSPASTTFPNLLLQLPGAVRGANGVVHINGDHGDINYLVDGVSIPQELNREIGSEFDVSNAAFVGVLEGAYPAQYGGRFAAVVNIGTRSGAGQPPGFSGYAEAGSYASLESTLEYHSAIGVGNIVAALHATRTARGLDPPEPSSPHNEASNTNQFLRFTIPTSKSDYLNMTFSHSLQTYQIPNDVAGGEPSTTDDNETQDDTFAALQYRHAIGANGILSFGPSFKRSQIQDFGDPANDFIFGNNLNIANGGSPTACADALSAGDFGPGTCAYSLKGYSAATYGAFNADYTVQGSKHTVGAGASCDFTLVPKSYTITLQPGNFLAPIYTPATPNGAYTVTDNAPNVGHTESAYIQDNWRLGPSYELDYGLRADAFQLFSSQFQYGASQFSPRIKFTRFFGTRAAVYAYYGRFFTPFSFQNVSPAAAQLLNLPLQPQLAQFDLRPQRDSVYEFGGHLPLGSGDLGIRISEKNAKDLIDDTQVGVTNLHQDINYELGRVATQTAYYQLSLVHNGRLYASFNHTYAVNKGCETQLLAPCFGSPTDWTPADHEQRWGATAGVIANDTQGGWWSFAGEYGSGLSSDACASTVPGFCKYTPHIVLDAEKGIALPGHTALILRMGNLLNDRYYITLANAQGNHVSAGRTLYIGLSFNQR